MYKENWLDVGCGGGEWVKEMAMNNQDILVIGIDNRKYPEWDKEQPPNAEYKVIDVTKLPFPDDYFDCVHANNLGPFDTDEVIRLVKEIQRVLKRGEARFSLGIGTHYE